jgi:hypothetical protein
METIISSSFGLIPFEDITVLPKNSQWHRLADVGMPESTSTMEVYDLLWVDGPSVSNRWRVYINPENRLPRRTELYQMMSDEQEYVLKSFKVIDYPTDGEMQTIIKESSF